jgi:hypothetical protein
MGGGRSNKPNFIDMTMKDIRELCKANQIKLSRVVNDKRVVYKKKELITKLKRKKVMVGGGQLIKKKVSDLTDDEKNLMFTMYVNSYTGGGQELWFKTPDDLFKKYPCFITFMDDDNNHLHLKVYAMFQMKKSVNKISLVCHDSTTDGKSDSINLRLQLVQQSGWILEAADKVSWLLRKNKAPIIENSLITTMLEIDENNVNDIIVINTGFDMNDSRSYQYTRHYTDISSGKTHESKETLFGTTNCRYNNNTCERICS